MGEIQGLSKTHELNYVFCCFKYSILQCAYYFVIFKKDDSKNDSDWSIIYTGDYYVFKFKNNLKIKSQ